MKNLKELLIEKGYEEGNNCYYKSTGEKIYYFNMNDNDEFTTVTVEFNGTGGQEEILYDQATIESLEEIERENI